MATIGGYKLELSQLLQHNCYCLNEFIDNNIKLPPPEEISIICKNNYIDDLLHKILNNEEIQLIYQHNFDSLRKECNGKQSKNIKDLIKNLYECSSRMIIDLTEQIKNIEKDIKFCKNNTDRKKMELDLNEYNIKKNKYTERLNQIYLYCKNNIICINCLNK